jgi:plasmid stability protein
MSNTFQITIRGLDESTKAALVRRASQQGVSLNRYALKALRQSVGSEDSEKRYLEIKQFLSKNKIEQKDEESLDEALSWSDKASLLKQSRE